MTAYPFSYKTKEDLLTAADKLGLHIPYSDDLSILGEKAALGSSGVTLGGIHALNLHGIQCENRFCFHDNLGYRI